jgi:hypothetical protein
MNEQVDAEGTQDHTRLRAQLVNQILRQKRTLKTLYNAPRIKLIRWNMVEIQYDQAYLSYKPHPSNHVRSRILLVNQTLWQVGTLKTIPTCLDWSQSDENWWRYNKIMLTCHPNPIKANCMQSRMSSVNETLRWERTPRRLSNAPRIKSIRYK